MNAQKLEAVRDDWNLMRRVRIIAKRHGSRELYYQCCNEAESLRGRMQYLETKSRQPNIKAVPPSGNGRGAQPKEPNAN